MPPEMLKKLRERPAYKKSNELQIIPVQFHAIRNSDGPGGSSYVTGIKKGLELANLQFEQYNMRFMQCGEIHVIDDESLPIVTQDMSFDIHAEHKIDGAINIYVAQSLNPPGLGRIGGWATFPWWRDQGYDYVFMAQSFMDDVGILSHEMGHHFGLYHTHNVIQTDSIMIDTMTMDTINMGIEFVDRSNCEFGGDMICDTAADPLVQGGNVSRDCEYIGSELDPLGVPYSNDPPDPYNLMSYALSCFNRFTPTQEEHLHFWMNERMPELYCTGPGDLQLIDYDTEVTEASFGEDFEITLDLAYHSFSSDEYGMDTKIYLSKNGGVDDSDILLLDINGEDIPENSYFNKTYTLTIPADYDKTGLHFLLIYADPENTLEELDEFNNFQRHTFFLVEPEMTSPTIDLISGKEIIAYPNPTSDQITIGGLDQKYGTVVLELYNIYGSIIRSHISTIEEGKLKMQTASLMPGMHILHIYTKDGRKISNIQFTKH